MYALLNYVYTSSVSFFGTLTVKDTTTDHHIFPIECNIFLQLLDTHSLDESERVPFMLSNELDDFLKQSNESYIIAIQLPSTKDLIYPNDTTTQPANIRTFDDMLKKDQENVCMKVTTHDDIFNILTKNKKIFEAMVTQNSRNYRGSFNVVLRKWKDYESSRKFLVSFEKSGWKFVHKYKSPQVHLKRYKNRFDTLVDLIGVDNYINETIEVHLSRTLEFEIIKII